MENKNALQRMEAAAQTFRERNAIYGDNYKSFGPVMEALFPNGITIKGADQFNRYGVLFPIMTKLTRYFNNELGHEDSIHDIGVYAFMAEELDAIARKHVEITKPPPSPVFWHAGGRIQDRDNPESQTFEFNKGWFFWDETGDVGGGPYLTKAMAEMWLERYVASLHCEHLWSATISSDHTGAYRTCIQLGCSGKLEVK